MTSRLVHSFAMLMLLGCGLAGASVQAAACLDPVSGASVDCAAGNSAPRGKVQATTVAFVEARDGLRAAAPQPTARAVDPTPPHSDALGQHTYALILAGLGAVAFMSGRRHR